MTRREQYGHIINISSMSGHRVPNGASGGAFYAATKYALRALTEGLRQEVRLRIKSWPWLVTYSPRHTQEVEDLLPRHQRSTISIPGDGMGPNHLPYQRR